ncbi:A disintegrin and metalloproteinase with thrombospondin motifs 3 [Cephus cinctus]|uniref:A disintegrin and metalloproteinase with thrombospondin motifs 3 n=1 Tax=Cephus cinctus TaxID=211228 RepID=A0AAJ7RMY4_CEPCN|nr:A disintegrin and metalloproteinase with thrombospondin motifs 3 [Cephus cinctus]
MDRLTFSHRFVLMGCLLGIAIALLDSEEGPQPGINGEIVYPKIIHRDEYRKRRSVENDETLIWISLKNWTLETRLNDRLIVSPDFLVQWIGSMEYQKSRDSSDNIPTNCEVRHGFVISQRSTVALTLCDREMYGLVHIENVSFFIQPLKDGRRHILYESATPTKWKLERGADGYVSLTRNDNEFHQNRNSKTNLVDENRERFKKSRGNSNLLNGSKYIAKLESGLNQQEDAGNENALKSNEVKERVDNLNWRGNSRADVSSPMMGNLNSMEERDGMDLKDTKLIENNENHMSERISSYELGKLNFKSLMKEGIDRLSFVFGTEDAEDNGIFANEILERFRGYLNNIILYVGNFNISRVNEFSTRASGHGPGSEEEEDLNLKLVEGSMRLGGREKIDYRSHKRVKRDLMICNTREFYNLTGDMIDVEAEVEEENKDEKGKGGSGYEEGESVDAKLPFEEDSEHIGYFFDRAWERDKLPKRKTVSEEAPPRWLEIGIAADYSVVDFHGGRVQQYILALLNIVSAIYKDPSLESNMKLVIVRMIFYAKKEDSMVRSGNARRSLENVNKWNRKLLSSSEESHDVAVWLTRLDIGGPSGYAPVSGACDPARSCALNRDEGLTSAFIIAHEVAHILGLSHDGDENAGNTCGDEASFGSVMAPMVAATFHRFHWSTCSKREFHHRAKQWSCLLNAPDNTNATDLKATLQDTFTMDEQCRMEFGDGYSLCRSFDLPEPCSHLWCGHLNSSQVCKTKKGPPLEGTSCGEDKWCINGYCEPVDRKRFGLGPVVHNARDGGWGPWGEWAKCSRTCGIGVQFRSRKCNKPTPAYGGIVCKGKLEEFRICVQPDCPKPIDLRTKQCSRLASLMDFKFTSARYNMTWLPYEPDQESLKCQLTCRSKQSGEIFFSGENLIDGTPCSYGNTDICIQGKCHEMGCDNILGSRKKQDTCGVCDGDNSNCNNVTNKVQRKLRRAMTRVAVVPHAAYNIRVDVTVLQAPADYKENVTITVRDRRRRRNDVKGFDSRGRGQILIVEGAAFRPQKLGDTYTMWAKGPLFAEIVVSIAIPEKVVKQGVSVSIFLKYTLNRNDRIAAERYSWLPGGWGPCSASCGGGTRQKTVACKDEYTGRIVPKRKCPLSLKPVQDVEKCNIFSCDFKWLSGPWEGCSATCGSSGVQYRQLYCVHSSFNDSYFTKDNELDVYRTMMPPTCCSKRSPGNKRECNRIPCQGRWEFTDWSLCSQSCGRGIQSRMARCVSSHGETLFDCNGSFIQDELRACKGYARRTSDCIKSCENDTSDYCVVPSLRRYCEVPGYRRRCCRSCDKADFDI